MGMYFSKYSMLRSLLSNDQTYLKSETVQFFEQFKLFGFIIHDPDQHQSFHRKLEEIFPRLDYLTGKQFLFFALTNPPQAWNEKEIGTYSSRDLDKVWNPDAAYPTVNASISAFTLAKLFNIDFESLPCIVLTSSFSSKYYVTIRTSEEYLAKQLTEIGFFCESISERSFLFKDEPFKYLLKKIDFFNDSNFKGVDHSVATLLSEFLSFVVSSSDSPDAVDARIEAKRVISTFNNSKRVSDISDSAFENKCLALLGSLSLTVGRKPHSQKNISNIDYDSPINRSETAIDLNGKMYCKIEARIDFNLKKKVLEWHELIEPESKITYKTLQKVLQLINELELGLDYSPFAIGYFKIFEREINLSVVHFVRKYLGIEMPQYFNRIKPMFDAVMIPEFDGQSEHKKINFNKGNPGKWNPPGLGESERVVKYLLEKRAVNIERMQPLQSELMMKWNELRIIRNKTAHTDPLSFEEFNRTKSIFESLIGSGILMSVLELKEYYKRGEIELNELPF